ncbi:hypothetical protein DL346_22905 [Paenibacillus montanisoli]|uniref:Uncharacterized protein n=1 Tax=Paenibacillus montanisoli TaxID=2081970 RepID=A0A328TXU0_9BACL|nr:hypothetical protein DL346_22905 [Paenibacillus montanisoli]
MSEFNLEGYDRQVCFEQDDYLLSDLGWPECVERVQLGGFAIFKIYMMKAEDIGVRTTQLKKLLTMNLNDF